MFSVQSMCTVRETAHYLLEEDFSIASIEPRGLLEEDFSIASIEPRGLSLTWVLFNVAKLSQCLSDMRPRVTANIVLSLMLSN